MSSLTLHEFKYIRETFPQIQLSDSWGITTSKSDDVIWNIVLAYLNSFSLSDQNELSELLKFLTGHQEENQNIQNSIESFNPFLQRDVYFSDEELSSLVSKFKERVEDYIETDDKQFQDEPKNFRYLEASSKLLSCNIVLISFPYKDHDLVIVFPVRTSTSPQKIYPKYISILDELIFTSKREIPEEKFSFGIPKEIGINKQRQALIGILKGSGIIDLSEEKIQEISGLPDISENFLISLLRSAFREFLPSIYESPRLLLKLADAGFETDPRTKDSVGKSAFFHALKTEESHLVFLLYDHAVDAFLQTKASVFAPDPVIVESLLHIKDHLRQLREDIKNEEVSAKFRCLHRDLSRFNEFQIKIYKSIIGIRCKKKCSNYSDEECEVLQRKEIVLEILKTYEIYFDSVNEEVSLDSDDLSCLKEYCEHKEFFDKLDLSFSVMFIDNLSCLKDRLLLPNNAYLQVEMAFILFLSFRKYLKEHEMHKRFISLCIAFQERKSLKIEMCNFKRILEKSELSKKTIVDKSPETAVYTLTKLSQIYGPFLISRLQYYLKAATRCTVKDLKSILIVERCLQVFSECFDKTFLNSIRNIISLAFPKELIGCLWSIHNSVSRMKSRELLCRTYLENNEALFIKMQHELSDLEKILFFIHSAHTHERNNFLLLNLRNSVCEARALSNLEDENLSSLTSINLITWKSYLDDMHTFLEKEIVLNAKRYIPMDNFYLYVVKNIILALKKQLKNLEVTYSQKVIEQLDGGFWYLKSFLSHVSEIKYPRQCSKILMLLLNKINSIFEVLRLRSVMNESTNTRIDKTVAKSEITEKNLPTENKNSQNPIVTCTYSWDPCRQSRSTFSFRNPTKSNQTEKKYSHLFEEISTSFDCYLQFCVNPGHSVISKVGNPAEKFSERENFLKLISECLNYVSNDLQYSARHPFKRLFFKNIKIYCLKLQEIFSSQLNWQTYDTHLLQQKLNVEEPQTKITESQYSHLNPEYLKNKKIQEKTEPQLYYESSQTIGNPHDSSLDIRSKSQSKETDEDELFENTWKMFNDSNVHSKSAFEQGKILPGNRFEQGKILPGNRFEHKGSQKKFNKFDSEIVHLKLEAEQRNRVPVNRFEFLQSRIKILKNILIEEHSYIQRLWNEATTPRRKFYVKEKIAQMYLNDSEIQASVEMLLFQFKTILRSKELEQLWKRTTNLLNCMNLRNSLVSKYPPIESLGRLLDPYNLPSELIEKMLKLITDERVLDCMQQILEESRTDFFGFMAIMRDDEDERFSNLREQIRECPHWKQYALLIPFRK